MARAPLIKGEDLRGVQAKLERANESIRNLDTEIAAFLKSPKGGFSKDQEKAFHEFSQHAKREIPPRFGVLAGEVSHHLRSALDHLVWLLSSDQYRRTKEAAIAFPILIKEPGKPTEVASYARKIEGIQSAEARKLIKQLQPYNAANPLDDPLIILHNLDRIDKHQTLVLIEGRWKMGLKIPLRAFTWTIIGRPDIDQNLFTRTAADQLKAEFSIQIAFPKIGERENQPVIPTLTQLADAIANIVRLFSEL